MSLSRNSTENESSNYHGNSSKEELDTFIYNSTISTTFRSALLSLWSTLSTTLEATETTTKGSSLSHDVDSTLSAGIGLNLSVTNTNSSELKGITPSPLPVSKLPRWRKKTTLSNTTTTTHVTTTQRHVTTQSLSTVRRTTLTTTTTILPSLEHSTAPPSPPTSTSALPQTVTNIKITENFSNVTYVTRDLIGGKHEAGNSTESPKTSSETPNKPAGYNQSIITPLVTPLIPLPVNGGEKTAEKHPSKHAGKKVASNNRVGSIYPDNRPISYWKPKDHADVHITGALLNSTSNNGIEILPSIKTEEDLEMADASMPSDHFNNLVEPNMAHDIPVAEPLIQRRFNISILVSSSTAPSKTESSSISSTSSSVATSSSSVATSSSSVATTSSTPSSLSTQATSYSSSLATSPPYSSTSNQTLATITETLEAKQSAKTPHGSSEKSTIKSPMSSSGQTTSTPETSMVIKSPTISPKPIDTELWLSFTNRPTMSSPTIQPTKEKQTIVATSTASLTGTAISREGLSSSTSQSKASSTGTSLLTTLKHSVAQNQESVNTNKLSEGHTSSTVSFTEPPFGDFLGPKPSFDPPKEEHARSVDMVNNDTHHTVPPSDQNVLPPSSIRPTRDKKHLGVAKPTVFSTTPVNSTLEKMVVGPVSKSSNTNMAAIVVPVLLVMIFAGVGAFFFFRKRSRASRNNEKSRKESMDVTTPLHVDLEQGSPVVDTGPVYARVDFSKKKTRGVSKGNYTSVQFHDRPLSQEATLLSSACAESRMNRKDRSSTSEESLAPRDGLEDYYVENDLNIEDERSLESAPCLEDCDDFDYMDSSEYTQDAHVAWEETYRDSGALQENTGDSPLRQPLLAPPIPFNMPHSDDGLTSDSDFEEVQSPDISSSLQRSSILEDYSLPTFTPPRASTCPRPHYDQVYIPRNTINNFVDSTNYVKGRKRSDSVHTNPYEEIGPAGGATGRGPVLATSGLGRGMAIYATVDETRMDRRLRAMPIFLRGYSSPPNMSTEELSNYGNQGASASPTMGPLLPTKRTYNSFRSPPLLLSRKRSRRRRTRSMPPRSRRDIPPTLPDRPSTPRRNPKRPHESAISAVSPDYVTSRSLDLLNSGCCDVDLDVLVPPADDMINPTRVLLPPALPERTQLPPKTPQPVQILDRPLPDPEAKQKQRPIPDRTSTTARTVDLERMMTYDVDLDCIVPLSREDLEDTFAPLIWLASPEPRYSRLLNSQIADKDDSLHQYTSLEAIPGSSKNPRSPRPNSLSSSKSEGHLDRTSTSSTAGQYLDINLGTYTVTPSQGDDSDLSDNVCVDYDGVYSPAKDPIYESVGNPSTEHKREE